MFTSRFIVFLFSLCCINGLYSSCDSLSHLRSTFAIENDYLTTAKGEEYPLYPYESKLHSDLAYILKDLKTAQIIHKAYVHHIVPVLLKLSENEEISQAGNEAFTKALLEICLLFGNPKHPPQEPLFHSLFHQGPAGIKWVEEYFLELNNFIDEANTPLYLSPEMKKENRFTVVILTTTSSGGNHSVANALTAYLSSYPHINPIQIDVEDIAKEVDPMIIATGTHTYDMIYSSIFQKTDDFSVIPGRKKLNREIHQYIPSSLLATLKQKIVELNPDLIISTRAYTFDDMALASLGVPFRMMHTDFELSSALNSFYRKVPSESIRFWLPTCQPSMFKPLFEAYHRLDLYNEEDDYDTLMEKMAHFLQVPLTTFKAQFEVVGYPSSSEFFVIDDLWKLQALREKWGVQEKEAPIFIVMGKHGAAAMREVFDNLLHSATKFPVKYLFICGKNAALKTELEEIITESEADASRFAIYGLLSPTEMNEVMNISHMGISKAGGATVTESLSTRKYLLLMKSHPWEEINASYLVEMGYALKFDPTKSLIEQIEYCLKQYSSNRKNFYPLEIWQDNLVRYIEELSS